MTRPGHKLVCLGFVVGTLCAHLVARLPAGERGVGYLAMHGWLTVMMLAAWRTTDPHDVRLILRIGVAARLVLLRIAPFTTSDVARYLWDGRVALLGFDPYRMSPSDPAVAAFRASWLPWGVHLDLPTLYPPGAIALFSTAAMAGPTMAAGVWKVVVTVASLALLRGSYQLLRTRGLERHIALVALSPLAVLEGGVGAHLDTIAAAALACALVRIDTNRSFAGGGWIAAGLLTKFTPGLVALPVIAQSNQPGRVLRGAACFAGLGYGTAALLGWRPIGSLFAALGSWRFGSPVWSALEQVVGPTHLLTGAIVLALVGLTASVIFARNGRLEVGVQLALAAPLIASPVVYPWYLLPLVPAVGLAPSATALAWLSTIPLTYEVIDRSDTLGIWKPQAWPLVAIAAAVAVGVVLDLARIRRVGFGAPRVVDAPTSR